MDGFECHNFGASDVDHVQFLFQVMGDIVLEDVVGSATVSDTLDHTGVAARIGYDSLANK